MLYIINKTVKTKNSNEYNDKDELKYNHLKF